MEGQIFERALTTNSINENGKIIEKSREFFFHQFLSLKSRFSSPTRQISSSLANSTQDSIQRYNQPSIRTFEASKAG